MPRLPRLWPFCLSIALAWSASVAQAPVAKPDAKGLPSAQEPGPKPPPAGSAAPGGPAPIGGVQYDNSTGWPIVAGEMKAASPPPAAPSAESTAKPMAPAPEKPLAQSMAQPMASDETAAGEKPALASGMQLGSPLLEVYQASRSPAAFKGLGGLLVWWRITIYGTQGEVIGVREVTHTADCAFAERDRLEYTDGRVYGRSGASVFAERQGMPWPTLAESAQHELALFGLQLRLPWCFGDAGTFSVLSRDSQDRGGERLAHVVVERRPAAAFEVIGPEQDPRPRDRFELLYEPSGGVLREFVQRFASSQQTRRVLLEDWHDVEGVRMPHRRVYVDETLRQTTTLEILRIEKARVTERDFRLR